MLLMFGLPKKFYSNLKQLNSPIKIQNFLNTFPINHEKNGETYMSPLKTLRAKKMHCFEGAILAALALWINGKKPLLLDLKTKRDYDHVVALYKINGHWGCISKTNHGVLRWRDPIYKTVRELAVSYFHEYFDNDTLKKTLRSYSEPFNLSRFGTDWITSEKDLHWLVQALDKSKHHFIFPLKNLKHFRKADKIEVKIGRVIEWKKNHPKT